MRTVSVLRLALVTTVIGGTAMVASCSSSSTEQAVPQTEAGSDAKVQVETGGGEAGAVCAPADVSTFQPPAWTAPNPLHANICTPAQIDAVIPCLVDDAANPTTCAALEPTPCFQCIFAPAGSSTAGAFVLSGQYIALNIAGCRANKAGDTTANGCGAKSGVLDECLDAACYQGCASASEGDTSACYDSAAAGGCAKFADSCLSDAFYTQTADCDVLGATEDDRLREYATLFCGAPPSDAGSDATTD